MRAKRLQFPLDHVQGDWGRGVLQEHFIDLILVRLPFFPVPPILVIELPLLAGVLLAPSKPPELLLRSM